MKRPPQDVGKPKKPPDQKRGRLKVGDVVAGGGLSRTVLKMKERGQFRSSLRYVADVEFDTATGLTAVSDRIHGSVAKTTRASSGAAGGYVTVEGPLVRMDTAALKELHGFTEEEIYHLVVPKRTLARRTAEKQPLSPEETDRAIRLARVGKMAETVFGSAEKAHRWLRKPKPSLEGETPLNYLASETGARVVEEMLTRIDHGILP